MSNHTQRMNADLSRKVNEGADLVPTCCTAGLHGPQPDGPLPHMPSAPNSDIAAHHANLDAAEREYLAQQCPRCQSTERGVFGHNYRREDACYRGYAPDPWHDAGSEGSRTVVIEKEFGRVEHASDGTVRYPDQPASGAGERCPKCGKSEAAHVSISARGPRTLTIHSRRRTPKQGGLSPANGRRSED